MKHTDLAGLALGSLWLGMGVLIGLEVARHAPAFPQPEEEMPAVKLAEPPPLDPADERLFRRLQARIDHRVETRLVESLQEAGKPQGQRQGIGSLVLAAVGAAVKAVLKAILMALVLAVLAALFWKYGLWLVAGFVVAVALVAAPVSWLTARAKR